MVNIMDNELTGLQNWDEMLISSLQKIGEVGAELIREPQRLIGLLFIIALLYIMFKILLR